MVGARMDEDMATMQEMAMPHVHYETNPQKGKVYIPKQKKEGGPYPGGD